MTARGARRAATGAMRITGRHPSGLLLAALLTLGAANAEADARRDFIAALVAGASSQRDVQAAEAELAASRQARAQLETSLRAATAAETAPLAARVEALRARPPVRPAAMQPPERLAAIDAELAAIAARRAEFERQLRDEESLRIAAEREVERVEAAAARTARELERVRGRIAEVTQFLRRLDQADTELDALIRKQARPRARRALEAEPLEALRTELRKLANMAASIRAESAETGAASFADVPAGRAILIAGPIADQVEAALEGIDKVMLPVLAISKPGDYLLSRQDRQGIVDILRAPPAPAPANDYDACLLRGLSGTSGDVAARAIIGACRAMHPGSARHDVVLRADEIRRHGEAYLLTGAAAIEVAQALRRFVEAAARLVDEQADEIRASTRADARGVIEGLTRDAGTLDERHAADRAAVAAAQTRLEDARATEGRAAQRLAEFAPASGEAALREERAPLAAALQHAMATAATAVAEANARQAEELAAAQRALAAALDTRRQADAQRLRPLVEREVETQQRLARATAAATASVGPGVAAKRAAFVGELGRSGVEGQFKATLRLDLAYGERMCLSFANQGKYAIANPGFELLFRGRSLRELGIDPKEFILNHDSFGESAFSYRNPYNEAVRGLRPGQTSAAQCNFIWRKDGDTGRAFERVGGSVTSWREASNWSVRVTGQLSLPDDVQEWREPYSSTRRWRHVATAPERLFAAEIAAAEAEARAQIERNAGTRGDGAAIAAPVAAVPPATAPAATPAAAPVAAADPARQEAALALDAGRIRDIQRRLTALGHDTRGADGRIGPGTRAALASFQRARGLPATGFLGPAELSALGLPAVR